MFFLDNYYKENDNSIISVELNLNMPVLMVEFCLRVKRGRQEIKILFNQIRVNSFAKRVVV